MTRGTFGFGNKPGHSIFLQDYMCAQRRLRLACAPAQANQCPLSPPVNAFDLWLPTEHPVNTPISLLRCTECSESSPGALAILYELLRPG